MDVFEVQYLYMPIAKLELTRYEKVVKKIVDEALEPYERRFSIQKTDLADTGWEIEVTPKSQKPQEYGLAI